MMAVALVSFVIPKKEYCQDSSYVRLRKQATWQKTRCGTVFS